MTPSMTAWPPMYGRLVGPELNVMSLVWNSGRDLGIPREMHIRVRPTGQP
ncbi:MAG: hypothetical protein HY898_25635 [Deltaproteobacteria bacterium]|nr:hypothetical protein [Deltaproteobacteria bacterium]